VEVAAVVERLAVGLLVGAMEGLAVGSLVGAMEELAVGLLVGAMEELAVGAGQVTGSEVALLHELAVLQQFTRLHKSPPTTPPTLSHANASRHELIMFPTCFPLPK